MSIPKTIQIFLPDGNPNGLKIIVLSNRNIEAYLVPRPMLNQIKREELKQPAIYVLCDREGTKAYIGECENFVHRVKDHDQKKDFWEVAIVFTAKGIDKAHVKYLESLAVDEARTAKRTEILNSNSPTKNTLHEFQASTITEFFEDLKLIISTLGYPIFDRVKVEEKDEASFWYCNRRATQAKAVYDENGFTVLAGSIIDGTSQPSFIQYYPHAVQEREQLFTNKAKSTDGGKTYMLKENITFTSANKAGGFVVGANVNAWTNWKNKDGRTMDEVMRKGEY